MILSASLAMLTRLAGGRGLFGPGDANQGIMPGLLTFAILSKMTEEITTLLHYYFQKCFLLEVLKHSSLVSAGRFARK